MEELHRDQLLGLPSPGEEDADALILPLPLEKTVSYGSGTEGGPHAILEASCQIETFDEQTRVDFERGPRFHTLPPLAVVKSSQDLGDPSGEEAVEHYLQAIEDRIRPLRDRFILSLGGEHTLTYATATALVDDPSELTVVQIDAHADLIDRLDGRRWSHGTVMRRLWEQGCRIVQLGIRSLSREEFELAEGDNRISTYYAHQLPERWPNALDELRSLRGKVYLTVDVDGLDPSVIPSTGTPQPDGLSWRQTLEIVRAVMVDSPATVVGADVVEFVPSPHPPGCDIVAARLVAKLLANWYVGGREEGRGARG